MVGVSLVFLGHVVYCLTLHDPCNFTLVFVHLKEQAPLPVFSLISVRKDRLLSIPPVGGITYRITVMLGQSWL